MYGETLYRRTAVIAILCLAYAGPAWAGPADDQYAVAAAHYSHGRWQLAAAEFRVYLDQFADAGRAASAAFYLGEALIQAGDYAAAREAYLKFLQHGTGDALAPRAQFRLGETAYLLAMHQEARAALENFNTGHPDHELNAYALAYLGEMALNGGEPAKAENYFAEALRRFAEGPLAHECRFGMARALELTQDWDGALRFYQTVSDQEKSPLADDALLHRGIILYQRQRHMEAATTLKDFLATSSDADLRMHGLYWQGLNQHALGDSAAAIGSLKAAQVPAEHTLAAAIVFALAETYQQRDDRDAAEDHYRRVAEEWPDCRWADDAWQARVELARQADRHEEVQRLASDFEQRFASSELRPRVQQSLGRSLLRHQQYEEAATVFRELLDGDAQEDTQQATRYYLTLAYLGNRQYEQALEALDSLQIEDRPQELAAGILVARASALMGLARYEQAIGPLRDYLELEPAGVDAPQCRAQWIIACVQLGQLEEARRIYDQCQEADQRTPLLASAMRQLAEAAYASDSTPLAHEMFTALAEQRSDPAAAIEGVAGLAWLAWQAERYAEAAESFRKLYEDHPEHPSAPEWARMAGRALEQTQRVDPALNAYAWLQTFYPKSPHTAAALLDMARLHEQQARKPDAAIVLKQLIEQHPEFAQRDAALYQWAWVMLELQQLPAADEAFRQLRQNYPQSRFWADATYRLAERAARNGDHRQALQLAEELIASDCDRNIIGHALYLRGQMAAALGQWPDVEAAMRRLTADFSTSPLAVPGLYWLAEAQYRTEQWDAAENSLEQLQGRTSGRRDAWLAMVPLRQAQILAHRKEWRQAESLARSISTDFPEFSQQYEIDYLVGRCLVAQARIDEAREMFQRATRSTTGGKTETAAMAQWMIGETYFLQKAYTEAIRAYHRVETLYAYPAWQAAALLQAAKCHERLSQWQQAERLYEQIMHQFADSEYAGQASARLKAARQAAGISRERK